MYCVYCGVKLAESEKKCPLCNTVVYHPDLPQTSQQKLFPSDKMPQLMPSSKVLSGAGIILFLIPLLVSLIADLQMDGQLNWFGYVAGAELVTYVSVALPLWFNKPNPVIFVPCSFAAATLYLLYICLVTHGNWFLPFAFPVMGGLCLIVTAVVTLTRYVKRGRLYIFGGASMLLGALAMLMEYLMCLTFSLSFIGWSAYPLAVLMLLGGLMIYVAINPTAREIAERKLFF